MEYVVGPVIALLIGMKFTAYTAKKTEARVTVIEEKVVKFEAEVPKKLAATMTPVAVAIKKLNQQVGI